MTSLSMTRCGWQGRRRSRQPVPGTGPQAEQQAHDLAVEAWRDHSLGATRSLSEAWRDAEEQGTIPKAVQQARQQGSPESADAAAAEPAAIPSCKQEDRSSAEGAPVQPGDAAEPALLEVAVTAPERSHTQPAASAGHQQQSVQAALLKAADMLTQLSVPQQQPPRSQGEASHHAQALHSLPSTTEQDSQASPEHPALLPATMILAQRPSTCRSPLFLPSSPCRLSGPSTVSAWSLRLQGWLSQTAPSAGPHLVSS